MARKLAEPSLAMRLSGAVVRWVAGYLVGLVVVSLLVLGGMAAEARLRTPGPSGPFVSAGAELSRAGARSIVWQQLGESLRQTCRDECDDIWFNSLPGRPVVEPVGRAGA